MNQTEKDIRKLDLILDALSMFKGYIVADSDREDDIKLIEEIEKDGNEYKTNFISRLVGS